MGKIEKGTWQYCGKRVRDGAPKRFLSGMTKEDMIKELGARMKTRGLNRDQLCKLVRTKRVLKTKGVPLKYDGANSCYLDTLMVSLYHRENDWLDQHTILTTPGDEFIPTHKAVVKVVSKIKDFMKLKYDQDGDTHLSNTNSNSDKDSKKTKSSSSGSNSNSNGKKKEKSASSGSNSNSNGKKKEKSASSASNSSNSKKKKQKSASGSNSEWSIASIRDVKPLFEVNSNSEKERAQAIFEKVVENRRKRLETITSSDDESSTKSRKSGRKKRVSKSSKSTSGSSNSDLSKVNVEQQRRLLEKFAAAKKKGKETSSNSNSNAKSSKKGSNTDLNKVNVEQQRRLLEKYAKKKRESSSESESSESEKNVRVGKKSSSNSSNTNASAKKRNNSNVAARKKRLEALRKQLDENSSGGKRGGGGGWKKRKILGGVLTRRAAARANKKGSSSSNSNSNSNSSGSNSGGETCVSLRRMFGSKPFKDINDALDLNWKGEQQDPKDVISVLEHMYKIPLCLQVEIENKGGGDKTEKRVESWGMSAWEVTGHMIEEKNVSEWSDIFPKLVEKNFNDITGKWRTTTTSFVDSPMLYVKLHRYDQDGDKLNNEFMPTSMIATAKNGVLTLTAVIIHNGSSANAGHYTALLKLKNGVWVYYNDMSRSLEVVGLYLKDAMAYKRDLALKNAVGFVFTKTHERG